MLSKRIAVPCPVEVFEPSAVVVELEIPLPLTGPELVSALYWGTPPECDPEELSDIEVATWVVQGVLCEGLMKVATEKPNMYNEDEAWFLASCERRIALFAASLARPVSRPGRRTAASRSAVAA